MTTGNCAACGHTHEGPRLASICVGCPCPERPRTEQLTRPILPCPSCGSYVVEHVCGSRLCVACGGRARFLVATTGEYDEAVYSVEAVCAADLASFVADSIAELGRVEVREIGRPPTGCLCPRDDMGGDDPIVHVRTCPEYEPLRDPRDIVREVAETAVDFDEFVLLGGADPERLVATIYWAAYERRFYPISG